MGDVPDGKAPIPVESPASGRREDRAGILPSVIAGGAAVLAAVVAGVFTLFSSSGGVSTGGASTSEANNPKSAHGAPTTSGMETLGASPTSSTPGGTAPSSPDAVRWADRVRLTEVNLDSVPAEVLSSNSGATVWVSYGSSKNVLYGLNGGFFTTKPSIALWEDAAQPTRQQCADLISTQGTETIAITDDSRFCVKTAADRVAYLVIKRFDRASGTYLADVTVWETPQE